MARSVEIARAFITLEAETKGLDQQLTQAEKSLGRVAKFVTDHPVAALSALGTAAIVAAFQLAKMAAETNKAIGIIADRVPGAVGNIDELRHVVNALAEEYAVSQDQIISTMDAVSRAGVRNVLELVQITKAATAAGRVLGKEGAEVVGGLDAALDIFDIDAKNATAAMVQFFAAAEGRTSVEDLQASLERLAPKIQGTGLDFVTATNAIAGIIDRGFLPGKPAIAEFARILEDEGVPGIRAVAEEAAGKDGAEGAVDKFTDALKRNVETIEGEQTRAQSTLKGQLVELGSLLEPLAQKALGFFASLVKGTQGINLGTNLSNQMLEKYKESVLAAATATDLSAAAFDALGKTGGIAGGKVKELAATLVEAKNATKDIGSVSVADLKRYKGALDESAKAGKLDGDSQKALSKIIDELSDRRKKGAKAAQDAGRDAAEARKILFELEKEITSATITLAESQRQQVEALEIRFGENMHQLRGKDLERAKAILDQARTQLGAKWKAVYDFIGETIEPKVKITEQSTAKLVTTTSSLTAALLPLNIAYGELSVEHDDAIEKQRAHREAIANTAFEVAEAVDVFGALATAIGLSDPELDKVVQGIGDVAGAIGRIASGDIAGGLIQGISGLSGVISGLFGGESESARQVRLGLEKTRDKLEEHRKTLGDLIEVTQPGAKVTNIGGAIEDFLAELEERKKRGGVVEHLTVDPGDTFVRKALAKRGLSLEDLEKLAKDLDIDLRLGGDSINIEQLRNLLEDLDARDSGFAETFEGQLDKLTQRWNIIGADVGRKLGDLVGLAGHPRFGSSALSGLQDFNLNTAVGQQGALAFLEQLLDRGDLTRGEMAGLNLQQFRDLLGEIAGMIRDVASSGATVGVPGPHVDPDRPPVAGLQGPAGTLAVEDPVFTPNLEASNWEELLGLQVEERDLLAGILEKLDFSPVQPPPLPAGVLGGASAGVSQSFTVTFEGPILLQQQPGDDGEALAHQLMEFIRSDEGKREMARALGEMLEDTELAHGLATVRR